MKGLKTNYSYVLLFLLAVLLPTNAAAQSYRTRGGEILNCFGWTYKQINDHLEDIKNAEFSAIQVSSVQPMLPKDTKELWYTVGGEKQGVTIYVKKDRDTAPYLYANTTDWKQLSGDWPGKQMYKTRTIDGQDYWYETFKVDGLNIIFNDGQDLQDDELKKKSQTENITNVTSDTFYRLYTDTGADREYAYEPLSGITAPTKHVSVYAKATEAPYLNVWGNGINGNGNMPGAQMWKTENIDGTKYYYDSFAAETINYSFNDGVGDGSGNYTEDTNKTADITNITATKYYEVQKPGAFEVTEENRITIYCKASKAPYLWAWNDKGNLTGDKWPGLEMTQTTTINGETFYYKTFKTDKINIIFSGGNAQTEDVNEIRADSYFEYDFEESKGNNLTQVTPGITIYCKATSAPYIWAWDPQDNSKKYTGDSWPGQQMEETTTIDGESYYYKTFNVANISFLLNNGNGSQTADITNVTRNRYFEYDGAETAEDIEDHTLYVKVSGDIPYLYVWKDDGTKLLGDFPGQPLSTTTTIDGETYYTYNFKGKINFIIYSNGKQSGDLSADRDKFYSVSNITTYAATELTGINEPSNVYAPSWAFIYEPLGIRMADNLLGTVDEFKALVTNAHDIGLGVVVGVEANSVSNKKDKLDGNIKNYLRDYQGTENWDMENREWITHHNVNVHTGVNYTYDLMTEDIGLQAIVKDFLDDLETAGVDGICWYHAKYIGVEQGHSYFNEAKGVPENTDLSHNNLEGDTFWENICDYWWTKKGKWCYGEIGADPFYKGNTNDPNHFECKWSHEDGYSRIVREYIFQMDLADAFYAKKNFTDGGCSWANGYWEAQTAEQAKLRKSMTITEFLDNKKTAGKSDLVYYAENADTYMQIWPEINGKSGGELYSSYDSNQDNQGVADRAYARVAGQDGATIVYFARPESPTSEIAPEELGSRALHFKTSPLVKELNKYHRIMNGYGEYITDNWEDGPGARASLCREQGAIVIKRRPNNNTQGEDVEIANGGSRTAAGTYTDKVWGKTFTINKNTIKGKLGDTGVAVLYDEQMVASQLAIVTPSSPNGEQFFSNGGTIKVTSQLANYNLQVQWSNNSRFSNYSGKANQQTITAGDKTPYEINIDNTYAGSNYHTWIYLRYRAVDPNNSRRYGNWQYHYYDLRNEDNKSSDESSIFHILYFKIPEQLEQADKKDEREAFLNNFKVYSWADQGNQAVVLTLPDGNPMPHPLTDEEIAQEKKVSSTWYRPVDLVYDGQAPNGDPAQIGNNGDTSYSDFVGNKKDYDPELGGSYCDVVTYAGQQFYRMTIGTPNFNFNVVNVQCNYDGKLLDTWTVDDDAFFDIQMDSDGRVSVAPLRRIVGDAVYNVGGFDNGKINFMDYSPKESTTTDKVYTYTGQFQKGQQFRIVAPIDYQNNYMYDSKNKDETCYKKYLKVYQTTQGVQIGGSSETNNKLKFKSTYTQTQGKYQEAGSSSLSADNPTFNLPTGLYTIKLHEVTTYNETSGLSETVPYYEVMKPKVSVEGTNNTTVSMVVDNETDPEWWKADITVSDPQAVKGNKIVIRDVDDSSLFTPLEYQVDTPDGDLTGEALYKNYSEAGTYRVKHVMGYKQKSGEEETSVPAQDKLYLGFNLSKVGNNGEPIMDTQGEDWSGYWGSFSDGKAREIPAGATAYAVSGYKKKENGGSEDFVIYLTKVSGTIPAETPLLLYYKDSDRSGIDDINIDDSNDARRTFFMTTGDNPTPVGDNWLAAQVAISNADRFKEYPNYQSPYTQKPDNNNYVLSYQTVKGEKVLGFFKVTKFPPENLQFRKAFLSIPKAKEARAVPLYWDAIMDFTNGVATSVSGLERGTAESQASYYNLQGIKVEKPTHGIYIRNGKKVIIK